MPLLFARVCDLFAALERLEQRTETNPKPRRDVNRRAAAIIRQWFLDHQPYLSVLQAENVKKSRPDRGNAVNANHYDQTNVNINLQQQRTTVALLSTLLPDRRPDRVFALRPHRLTALLGRVLGLGPSRQRSLERWRVAGGPTLAECVQSVVTQAPPDQAATAPVMVEEIDAILDAVAATSRFSSEDLRARCASLAEPVESMLQPVFARLAPIEAKWLTRLLLRNLGSIALPEWTVWRATDSRLPALMQVRENIIDAVACLYQSPIRPFDAGATATEALKSTFLPKHGIKVAMPAFWKGRSVKHVMMLARRRQIALEPKYDGQYLQVHISRHDSPRDRVKMFSKRGKESARDFPGLSAAILKALDVSSENASFQNHCILAGELVVWDAQHQKILPFHKLRKHVRRGGRLIGAAADSLPHPWESLMFVAFDVLALDDQALIYQPYARRRQCLCSLIKPVPGQVTISPSLTIDTGAPDAARAISEEMAFAIAQKWEGLVMKPIDDHYFGGNLHAATASQGHWVKLKKDYIAGLGDTIDLAIVGARFNAESVHKMRRMTGQTAISWTDFAVGCLVNRHDVLTFGVPPRFRVLDTVSERLCRTDWQALFARAEHEDFLITSGHEPLDIEPGSPIKLQVTFTEAITVEMRGFGFEKPTNCPWWMLRFPRMVKLLHDRTYLDCVDFDELQTLAKEATTYSDEDWGINVQGWQSKLAKTAGSSLDVNSGPNTISPASRTSSSSSNRAAVSCSLERQIAEREAENTLTTELRPASSHCRSPCKEGASLRTCKVHEDQTKSHTLAAAAKQRQDPHQPQRMVLADIVNDSRKRYKPMTDSFKGRASVRRRTSAPNPLCSPHSTAEKDKSSSAYTSPNRDNPPLSNLPSSSTSQITPPKLRRPFQTRHRFSPKRVANGIVSSSSIAEDIQVQRLIRESRFLIPGRQVGQNSRPSCLALLIDKHQHEATAASLWEIFRWAQANESIDGLDIWDWRVLENKEKQADESITQLQSQEQHLIGRWRRWPPPGSLQWSDGITTDIA